MSINELPLVSIIIPTYNGLPYLEEAITSILSQDYPKIELIVLDDGSTDNTKEFIQKFKGKLYFESHENMGQAATLNKGWKKSKGEIIGYLSSDDKLLPNAVSKLIKFFIANPDAAAVYPNFDLIDCKGGIIGKIVARSNYEDLVISQECYIGPGALFKRIYFEQTGGWNQALQLTPDREFWMRIGLKGSITVYPEILAQYRVRFNSISNNFVASKVADEYIDVIENFYASNDLPKVFLEKKSIIFGRAYLMASLCHLKSRRYITCIKRLQRALSYGTSLKKSKIFVMLLRALLIKSYFKLTGILRKFKHK